ncbi:MAG: DUF418 domain-containing protein [Woeseia sp.]
MSAGSAAATPDQPASPVSAGERLAALDTLRGVAVLGILMMNIYAFAMPFAGYMNPLNAGGSEWYNLGTWFVTHILADQKFISIFSMLFGAGIVLMWQRASERGASFGRIFYRRMFWLLVIGLLHGYLIWFGDILFYYAVIGMLVYFARGWRPRTLIVAACVLLPVTLVMSYGGYVQMLAMQSEATNIAALRDAGEILTDEQQATLDEWNVMGGFMAPTAENIREDLEAHRGSYADIMQHRVPQLVNMQVSSVFFMFWRVGGMMLIGMAFMKLGILSGQRTPSVYNKLMLIGYGLGLPIMLFSAYDLHAHQFDGFYFMKQGSIANYVGSILIAFGHIGMVMRLVQRGVWHKLMQRFAAVGRMAFSNYLMHSIILTSVFYGYGLGLYGEVPRAGQMLFVAGVIGLQLIISPWWLARYRFGPAEWLWRSLTYWRRQPMRA